LDAGRGRYAAEHLDRVLADGARVCIVGRRGQRAARCLEVSNDVNIEPFYLAYAHEAAARAAAVAGDDEALKTHRDEAARIAETLEDEDSRQQLQQDLATIE
jgi:hypothetical protein